MVDQEKIETPENDSSETAEQKAVSEQLQQMARGEAVEPQAKKEGEGEKPSDTKLIKEIRKRAESASEKVKQRVEERFISRIMDLGKVAGDWLSRIQSDFDDDSIIQEHYSDWSREEIEELRDVLYGGGKQHDAIGSEKLEKVKPEKRERDGKTIKDIKERAKSASGTVKEKIKELLPEIKNIGDSSWLYNNQIMFSSKARRGKAEGFFMWKEEDFEELYRVLYGKDMPESFKS
ncbi:MAG: hypothetical protein WC711_02865 [Candidatus Staskawiczbacteria bacterium]|jgi:hypothetical protein